MADPVSFTRPAAERIAKVVRAVEYGNRDSTGPSLDRPWYGDPSQTLRLGTFTGNWETAQYTTVTLHGSTVTASVYNWCNPALGASTSNTTESRYVIFSKVKGTNSAVEIQMRSTQCTSTLVLGSLDLKKLPGFQADVIQLLGHSAGDTASTCSGGLQWYSITTCATATSS
jgi:hypothetical protein